MATNSFTIELGSVSALGVVSGQRTFTVTRGDTVNLVDTSAQITVVATASLGPAGATGSAGPIYQMFTVPGELNVGTGKARFYAPIPMNIGIVAASVGTAPTGASIIVDVYKNGSTVFTTAGNRPAITIGSLSDLSSVPDIVSLDAGDYLTVGIVQVGSTVSGSDLTIQINLQPI
jgi:hypothetical protein